MDNPTPESTRDGSTFHPAVNNRTDAPAEKTTVIIVMSVLLASIQCNCVAKEEGGGRREGGGKEMKASGTFSFNTGRVQSMINSRDK